MQSYTVSELNQAITDTLQGYFYQAISVEGEISNFSASSVGHWYFTLKDDNNQIAVVMFKGSNSKVVFEPQNGNQVNVVGTVSYYKARGQCQIICQMIRSKGTGAILAMLEKRKQKLQAEGLFEKERKKSLPIYAQKIGIITGLNTAALQDILKVFNNYPLSPDIHIFDCPVQGESSASAIVQAFNAIETYHQSLDVILIVRGGGSTEDLLSFSDEAVVYAIANSSIPVISGVGHEIDFPICDFAADMRAPTPTGAASIICEQCMRTIENIKSMREYMQSSFKQKTKAIRTLIQQCKPTALKQYLVAQINNIRQNIDHTTEIMGHTIAKQITQYRQQINHITEYMQNTSPHTTLKRGYSLTYNENHTQIITHTDQVSSHDKVYIVFQDGEKSATIH